MTIKAQQKESKKITKNKVTVAEYLTAQIDLCGKTQLEIAREAGFETPNIITMLKQGKSKLPLARIPAMARALGVDAKYLFRLAMSEYDPEVLAGIEGVFDQPILSDNDLAILDVYHSSNQPQGRIRTVEERERLLAAFNKLRPDIAAAGD
jgi:transcriptional regulator with XRE-family HTH domain